MTRKLILIPGTQCDERLWGRLMPLLDGDIDTYHFAIPQLPLANVLQQLRQVVMENDGQNITLLGFSLGGYLVAKLLERYPELNGLTILICANTPTQLPEQELKQRQRLVTMLEGKEYAGISTERVCYMLDESFHHDVHLIALIKSMDKELGAQSLAHQLAFTGQRQDLSDTLNSMARENNITLLCADSDPLINKGWLDKLNNNVRIKLISGRGHMLPLQFPERLASEINA